MTADRRTKAQLLAKIDDLGEQVRFLVSENQAARDRNAAQAFGIRSVLLIDDAGRAARRAAHVLGASWPTPDAQPYSPMDVADALHAWLMSHEAAA